MAGGNPPDRPGLVFPKYHEIFFIDECLQSRMEAFPDGSEGKEATGRIEDAETQVQSLGREDPLEEGMASLSSILAEKSPCMDRGAWWATVQEVTKSQT